MPNLNQVMNIPTNLANVSPAFMARTPEPGDMVDPEVTRLKTTNPLYDLYAPEWDFYLSAYEGGKEFVNTKTIHKHPREHAEDYRERLDRAHYLNYCEELVDFFTYFIFSETIHRDGGANAAWYQEFITDVNRKGENVEEFMRQVEDDLQIFGMSYVLVDSPKADLANLEGIVTKQNTDDLGIKPYWVLVKPCEIVDWTTDDFENFTYVKRCQSIQRIVEGERKTIDKYTEWTAQVIQVSYVDVTDPRSPELLTELTEVLPNPLNEIPLLVGRHKRSKRYPFMGNSFLRDFAYNNAEVMNYTSLIQEFLYKQCFNILAKEADSSVPLRDQNDGVLGTSNILEYPKGTERPAYITPPVDPAEFLQSERARIIAEMFKRAAQETMNELFNGEKSSGFSQAQSFSKTVPFISTRADTLERLENKLMALTMKRISKTWDGKVKYKDRYEITNITDAITQLTSMFRDLLFPSETFVKEELKRLANELDGKIPPEKLGKVMKEIEDMDFDKWQETQKEALVGKGSSPAEQQRPKPATGMAEAAAEARVNTGATKKLRGKKNK